MAGPKLTAVTRTQGANEALKNGDVRPRGAELVFEEVPVLVHAFRRMVRGLEFDVCEMALTTYLVAREHGVRFTALPVFLVRGFHHGAILYDPRSGLRGPKDLEGRRVGVNRGYTVTTGVWARAVLDREYGVDLDRVTWVLSGDEHVPGYRPPANVEPMPEGGALEEMVLSGELAAVVGLGAHTTRLAPLLPDPEQAALASFAGHGTYPVNHLVVVRDDVLRQHPDLAADLFGAFAEAKRQYVERLAAGAIERPTPADLTNLAVLRAGGRDPLPYGIEPNRAVLEELTVHAVRQHILRAPLPLEELFADGTHDLTA
ncbi:ABC transporter substrate-binding protein [Actinacidiphila acididurans]|uniref:ABC transporter substrate-binding protein n=1 Tax=Actinacidiphila acididurans TaxID=2784346 RepID=A0ABS2TMY3_9ACTN|nr:ABC transporter substrate-binding protein [Actinacidiphila acididurans]MBM9503348.1 ABC transporter substrate-binding protein [Actinacidiphila acididurans]